MRDAKLTKIHDTIRRNVTELVEKKRREEEMVASLVIEPDPDEPDPDFSSLGPAPGTEDYRELIRTTS